MKKPKKLPEDIVKIFTPLLESEYKAFYFYKEAANYCKNVGFAKAAAFFEAESADELVHAKKLQDFLVDWNIQPELPTILTPDEVESLLDAIETAYDLEYQLYSDYEAASVKVLEIGDVCVFDLFQYFRNIQMESVAQFSDMLNLLEGTEASKIELLLLEEQLFGE